MSENAQIQENHTNSPSFRHFTTTIRRTNNLTHILRTVVTATETVVDNWIRNVYNYYRHYHVNDLLIIGVSVQWIWTNNGSLKPATLQLFRGNKCLILLLQHSSFTPLNLLNFLSDPRISFVSLSAYPSAGHLSCNSHGLRVMLPNMPIFVGELEKWSVNERAEVPNGWWSLEVDKSNWSFSLNEISLDQVRQATMITFVAYTVGLRNRAYRRNPNIHRRSR